MALLSGPIAMLYTFVLVIFPILVLSQFDYLDCPPNVQEHIFSLQHWKYTVRKDYPTPERLSSPTGFASLQFFADSNTRTLHANCLKSDDKNPKAFEKSGGVTDSCEFPNQEWVLPSDSVEFLFEALRGTLVLSQSYKCWNETTEPESPKSFKFLSVTAHGEINIGTHVDCTEQKTSNADWKETGKKWLSVETQCIQKADHVIQILPMWVDVYSPPMGQL